MRRKNVREKYFHVHIRRGCEGKTSKQTYARTLSFTHTYKHTLSLSYTSSLAFTHTLSHTHPLFLSLLSPKQTNTRSHTLTQKSLL